MKTNQRDAKISITTQHKYKYQLKTNTVLCFNNEKCIENKVLSDIYNNTLNAGQGLQLRSEGFPWSIDQQNQQWQSPLVTGVECV